MHKGFCSSVCSTNDNKKKQSVFAIHSLFSTLKPFLAFLRRSIGTKTPQEYFVILAKFAESLKRSENFLSIWERPRAILMTTAAIDARAYF